MSFVDFFALMLGGFLSTFCCELPFHIVLCALLRDRAAVAPVWNDTMATLFRRVMEDSQDAIHGDNQ